MTEEKKQNLNKLIFIIFEIFSVISCITCILLIKVEEKQLLALLPLGFAVITLFFQKELMQDNIIILIIDALYFVILEGWIPYTSRSLCFTQCALQILSELDGLQDVNK